MNFYLSLWSGAGLLDMTLKALLVVVLAGCLAAMLRKSAASTRHAVWLAAIVLLTTLPIASVSLPRLSLPLLPAEALVANAEVTSALAIEDWPLLDAPRAATSEWASAISLLVNAWSPLALVVWATGFLLLIIRAAVGLIRLECLRRGAEEVDDATWRRLVGMAKKHTGVQRDVCLLVSPGLRSPITWGLWRIHVCVPAQADEWTLDNRRMVLAHELTHARRADWLWQLLTIAMAATHWFNPLAWWAAHRLRMEAEIACDDEVIKRGWAPSVYADCLYQMVRAAKSTPFQANVAIPMARPSGLLARMARILDDGTKRHDSRFRAFVLTLAISTIAGSVFATAHAVRAQPEIDDHDSNDRDLALTREAGHENARGETDWKLPDLNPNTDPTSREARYNVAEADIIRGVKKGEMTREEARQELEDLREELWGSEDESWSRDPTGDKKWERSARWMEYMVDQGVLTCDEAKKTLEFIKLQDWDDRGEIAIALRRNEIDWEEGKALLEKARRATRDAERSSILSKDGIRQWFRPEDRFDAKLDVYEIALDESGLDADQIEVALGVIGRILESTQWDREPHEIEPLSRSIWIDTHSQIAKSIWSMELLAGSRSIYETKLISHGRKQ